MIHQVVQKPASHLIKKCINKCFQNNSTHFQLFKKIHMAGDYAESEIRALNIICCEQLIYVEQRIIIENSQVNLCVVKEIIHLRWKMLWNHHFYLSQCTLGCSSIFFLLFFLVVDSALKKNKRGKKECKEMRVRMKTLPRHTKPSSVAIYCWKVIVSIWIKYDAYCLKSDQYSSFWKNLQICSKDENWICDEDWNEPASW